MDHKILKNSRFFPKIGGSDDQKTLFFKESSANPENVLKFREKLGSDKIGAHRRKNLSRRRKIFVKNIFYFRQKNVVKISKNWGHENVEARTSHTAGNPYILQYFLEISGRQTSTKTPKFPGNP